MSEKSVEDQIALLMAAEVMRQAEAPQGPWYSYHENEDRIIIDGEVELRPIAKAIVALLAER